MQIAVQDIYYGGYLSKWQKAVNTFKLHVLMSLGSKTCDADLNVAGQFASILNDLTKYPIFTSAADELAFVYIQTYNQYPLNISNFGSTASRFVMAATYVKGLTQLKIPRVYVNCEPA
ncbi:MULTISPECIES: SusD/RagB family nutrient-binding outer membrane lipoprotein [Chitinophagaceae]